MTVPSLRREVLVDADPALAFSVFTGRIGAWWPLGEFSVHGDEATVAFDRLEVGGRIVESLAGASDAVWGTVTRWEPGAVVAFTWHPGHDEERASRVTVTFEDQDGKTLVRLEHDGWEAFGPVAEEARAEYGQGWPVVLDRYAAAATSMSDTWVALFHTPTDLSLAGGVFADPRFGDHVAFLQRMDEAGYLVAAGSFADRPGSGMTILRLPGHDRFDEAHRLATVEDASVASGFFSVDVRPWSVVLHG